MPGCSSSPVYKVANSQHSCTPPSEESDDELTKVKVFPDAVCPYANTTEL